MIFRFLGGIIRRGWVALLAAWVALLVVTRLAAPPFDDVAQSKEFGFLPADMPSRVA